MTVAGARTGLAAYIGLQVIALEFGAWHLAQHWPGRPMLFFVHVLLAVASVAAAAVLWRAELSKEADPPWRRAGGLLAVGVLWLLGLSWSVRLPRPFAYLALSLAITGLAFLLVSLVTRKHGPLFAGGMLLGLGNLLFGSQVFSAPTTAHNLVNWGDETTFRTFFPPEPPFVLPGGRLRVRLDARMKSAETRGGVRIRTNGEGFRNDADVPYRPAAGELRLLDLGDSFSIGMQIDQDEFFGARLERELETGGVARAVTVLNAEVSDPAHALYYLQNFGLEYAPRLVVLGLCANDMQQAAMFCGPRQRMRLDEHGRIVVNPAYAEKEDDGIKHFADLAYSRSGVRGEPSAARPGNSKTLSRLQALGEDLRAFDLVRDVLDRLPQADAPHLMPGFLKEEEARDGRMRLIDGCTNLGYFYRPPLPEIEGLYENLFALLGALDTTAREIGARLVVLVYPQRYQVNAADWAFHQRYWNLTPEDFDLRLYDRRLQEACARLGIPCCNLLEPLLAAQKQIYLPAGDMHLNRAGHAIAARAMAEFLRHEELLPAPATLEPGSAEFEAALRRTDPEPLRPWRFQAHLDETEGGCARFLPGGVDHGRRWQEDQLLLRGGTKTPTSVVYELKGRAWTFRAKVKLQAGKASRVRLAVAARVDGREVWSQTLDPGVPAIPLALDLRGAQRLELVALPRTKAAEQACAVLGGLHFERALGHEGEPVAPPSLSR